MRDIEAGASMISNPRLFPGKERVTNALNTCVLQLFLSTEVHIFMAVEETRRKASKDGRCRTTLACPGADTGQQ